MKTNTPAYEAANLSPHKELRLVAIIQFATPLILTSHSDITGIPAGDVIQSSLIKTSSTSAKLNTEDGRTEIGDISFEVIDKAEAFTGALRSRLDSDEGITGKFVELYSGFEGLDFSDFRLEQTQVIDKELTHNGGTYAVKCRDIQRQLRKDIFDQAKTRLSASVGKTDTTIPVYDTSSFEPNPHGPSYGDAPNQSVYYFKIKYNNGFEICRATGKTATSFTGVTRGVLGSKALSHTAPADANPSNGPEIIEYIYLELPALKLAYAILTGKILGTADTIPSGWHLGVPEQYVDLDSLQNIGTDLFDPSDDTKGFITPFYALSKTDGKRFIEKEILLLAGVFVRVLATGELGFKRMSGVLSDADYIDTLDASNITKAGDLVHDLKGTRNVLDIHWSWLEYPGEKAKFYRRDALLDPKSIERHGLSEVERLQFKGLHNSRHTYTTLKNKFDALRDRFAGPPQRLKLSVLPSKGNLEIGDLVRVNLSHLRDFADDGTFDRTMEIQQIKINQVTGSVDLDLFGSSDQAGPIADGANYTLPDGWYISEGTNAGTPLSIDGAGTLTADGTLTGYANSRKIFYYDGDLTIPGGRTLTIEDNVELRVKGHLQIDGSIVANGLNTSGAGFIGTTKGGDGTFQEGQYSSVSTDRWRGSFVYGENQNFPPLEIENNGGSLSGIPSNLCGSQGGLGGSELNGAGEDLAMGGAGGKGGGGLAVIARGLALGGAGKIDTSGADGSPGANANTGSGGGGAPGGFLFLQDGSSGTTPFLQGKMIADYGESPSSPSRAGKGGFSLGLSASRIMFVPQSRTAYPDYEIDETALTGAGRVFVQSTPPLETPPLQFNSSDLWYDDNDGNHPYHWNGTAWVSLRDGSIADALIAAQDAQTTADEARLDYIDLNAEFTRLTSDSVLTVQEKKQVIMEVDKLNDERGSIVATADFYGITTEKTAYENELDALNSHLATLTTPTAWNVLTGDTNIDYSAFNLAFNKAWVDKQKLLDKIAEAAGEAGATPEQVRQIQNSRTVFYHTFDNQSQIEEWEVNPGDPVPTLGSTNNIRRGGGCFVAGSNSGTGTDDRGRYAHLDNIPFDPDTLYSITFYVRQPFGAGPAYLGVKGIAGDGVTAVNVSGNATHTSSQHYFAAQGEALDSGGFVAYTGWFKGHASSGNGGGCPSPGEPGTMHSDTRFFRPIMFVNWDNPGTFQCDAVVIKAYDGESMNNLSTTILNPGQLSEGVATDQGNGTFRRTAFGLSRGEARDGDYVTFDPPFNTPPSVRVLPGGLTKSGSLSGDYGQYFKAKNVTGAGFEVVAKLRETASGVTARTDSSPVSNGSNDYVMHKSQSAQAYDDQYKFQFDVTVTNTPTTEPGAPTDYIPGNLVIAVYTNDGAGWVERGQYSYSGSSTSASTTLNNRQVTVTVDGLTNHGGYEFRVKKISGSGTLNNFDKVTYSTATAPGEVSATPTGVSDLTYEVLGGE